MAVSESKKKAVSKSCCFQARAKCKQTKIVYLTSVYTFLEGNKEALHLRLLTVRKQNVPQAFLYQERKESFCLVEESGCS